MNILGSHPKIYIPQSVTAIVHQIINTKTYHCIDANGGLIADDRQKIAEPGLQYGKEVMEGTFIRGVTKTFVLHYILVDPSQMLSVNVLSISSVMCAQVHACAFSSSHIEHFCELSTHESFI